MASDSKTGDGCSDPRFPILGSMDFLNHAAVAPISGPAAEALRTYATQAAASAYVGHGWYAAMGRVKQAAARLINAEGPRDIALIPNTSFGLNLVARGVDWRPGDRVVTTAEEYPANRYPWRDLTRVGVVVYEVEADADGRVPAERVADAVDARTRVVSVSHVQYATGYRTDLRPIADAVHAVGGLLCVDAIQSCGVLPVDVWADGVDCLAADGHKWMLGPEGAGFFYAHRAAATRLHPAVIGWMNRLNPLDYDADAFELPGDARRFEAGTWNIPGTLALGASLELLLSEGIDRVWSRVEALTQRLDAGLAGLGLSVTSPRTHPGERSGIVAFDPPAGVDAATAAARLQALGTVVAVRGGRLRASPHFYNRPEQIDRLVERLAAVGSGSGR